MMKTRQDELRELREREERSQKWVYGICFISLLLTLCFMVCDAYALEEGDDFIIIKDGKTTRCFVDYMGNIICQ